MIEYLWSFSLDNWGAIASIIISSIIGFATSYYFFWKQKQKRQLSYTCIYNQLYADYIKDHVFYDFRWGPFAIKNPYLMRVIVWNDGNETIARSDLSKADPLRINFSDIFILAARWREISSLSSMPNLDIDEENGRLNVDFEFLEPGSGFAIDVVGDFAGEHSHPIVFLTGSVRGSKIASRYRPSGFSSPRFLFFSGLAGVVAVLSLSGLVPLVALFTRVDPNLQAIAATLVAIGGLIVGLVAFAAAIGLWPRAYYPDMVGATKQKIGEGVAVSARDKWRVAATSLTTYGANAQAAAANKSPL